MFRSTRTRRGCLVWTVLMEAFLRGPCPGTWTRRRGAFHSRHPIPRPAARRGARRSSFALTAQSAGAGTGRRTLKAAPCVEPLRAEPRLAALGVLAELDFA